MRAQLELALDHVERALGPVDEDELLRAEGVDLAGQLGADRPAGAGDHHDLVADRLGDRRGVGRDLLAGQEVLEPDVADAMWRSSSRRAGSWTGGTVRTWRPASTAASMIRRIDLARGVRHRDQQHPRAASGGSPRRAGRGRRRPAGRRRVLPRLAGSLSRNPTGLTPASGSRMADRAIIAPARPAPNRSAGVRLTVGRRSTTARVPTSLQARMKNRVPPISARLKTNSRIQKDGGEPRRRQARAPRNRAAARTIADHAARARSRRRSGSARERWRGSTAGGTARSGR